MIFVVGGCAESCEEGCLATCEYLTSLGADFLPFEKCMHEPRRGTSCFRVGKELIAVGGCSAPGVHLSSVEVLTLPTTSSHLQVAGWESAESKGEGLPSFSCAASCQLNDDRCLLFGGYNGRECLDTVCSLRRNAAQRQLSVERLSGQLPCRLKNSAAALIAAENSVVYLFGGWDEKRTLNTIISYSAGDGTSTIYSLMPTRLEGHTATLVGPDRALICGGYNGVRVQEAIYMFHLGMQEWTTVGRLETARENHATVFAPSFPNEGGSSRNLLLVIGGWNGFKALESCEAFEVLDESPWLLPLDKREVPKLNVPRNKPSAIFIHQD